MKKIYAAFLDSFKELAFEIKNTPYKKADVKMKINKIMDSILKIEKLSKFIEIYEILEDFAKYYKVYVVSQ